MTDIAKIAAGLTKAAFTDRLSLADILLLAWLVYVLPEGDPHFLIIFFATFALQIVKRWITRNYLENGNET